MKSLKERLTDLEGDIAKLIKELARSPDPIDSYSKEEIDKIIKSLPKPVAQKIDVTSEVKKIITSEFISDLYRNK